MGGRPYRGFMGGSYVSQSPEVDCEDLMNFYPEISESNGAKTPIALYPSPGVRRFSSVAQLGGRAMFTNGDGRVFGVTGQQFYEYFADGSSIARGAVAFDANPAFIASNGNGGQQLGVCAGDHFYCYDLVTNTLTEVLTSGATFCGFLYGYFVVLDNGNSRVQMSDLFDGLVFDPTNFFEPTISEGPWIAMQVTRYGQIWLLGPKDGEVWYNAGTFPIPFAPHPSGLVTFGIAAPFTLQESNDAVTWLATNTAGGYKVMRATGYRPERVSNHAEEYAFTQYARVDDAIGSAYSDQGHDFLVLKFPTAQKTRVLDFTTGFWAGRGTWIAEDNRYVAWRPTYHCFGFGRHLWADSDSGFLYEANIHFAHDVDSRVIRRYRTAPAISRGNLRLFFGRFELELESGLGLSQGQGSDPQVTMQCSNDGGKTWGTERSCGAGKMGEYGKRVFWDQNGSSRNRSVRTIFTDPIDNWRIVNAYQDVEVGDEAA